MKPVSRQYIAANTEAKYLIVAPTLVEAERLAHALPLVGGQEWIVRPARATRGT